MAREQLFKKPAFANIRWSSEREMVATEILSETHMNFKVVAGFV